MTVRGGGAAAESDRGNSNMDGHPPSIRTKMADDDEGTTEATAFAPRQIARRVPRQHGAPNRDAASRPPTHTILGVRRRLQRRRLAAEVNGDDRRQAAMATGGSGRQWQWQWQRYLRAVVVGG